jgi:acetylglutamate/LysW-gamma-L-alpha-aminoadipate kinase
MSSIVIKLGGAAGVDAGAVLADVAGLAAEGRPVVLVHGTSAAADALAERAGVPVRRITSPSGHVSRYTDPETLELYVAAAAGQVNKALVAGLQGLGCNAVGLSGVDGRLLVARRKDAVRAVENGRQRIIRDDFTGQLEAVNGDLLRLLLAAGYTPVVAPLALGHGGERLNVDGDRAAALVAGALAASALILLSNVPGLLADFPDESSLVRRLPAEQLGRAEEMAQGRMKKKILAAREALAANVPAVILADSRCAGPIRAALAGEGTVIGDGTLGPGRLGPGTLGPGTLGPGTLGPGTLGPGTLGPGKLGPGTLGPGTLGPGKLGPGTLGPGKLGPGTLGAGTHE